MIPAYIRTNRWIIGFLLVFVFALSLYANTQYFFRSNPKAQIFFPPFKQGVDKLSNTHFGAEYYCIAQALVEGKGFSNPFGVDTGPTAWMPPLYPYMLAFLIALFQKKILILCFLVFLQNLVLVAAGLLIHTIAQKTHRILRAEVAVALYCLLLVTFFRWFFQITHDIWLLLLLVCILYPWAMHMWETRVHLKQSLFWGFFGGVCVLASPILGAVWGATALVTMVFRQRLKYLVFSFVVCFAVCLPWMVRNYVVFDRLILMKSNMYFDLFTANYETERGLFNEITFIRQHPFFTLKTESDAPYRVLGEMGFMDMYKKKFQKAFAADPGRYFNNSVNRFIAAFILYPPYCQHEESVIEKPTVLKVVVHFLPLAGIILILLAGKRPGARFMLLGIFIYVLYLMPYVLVNYYNRYGIPLTPFKVLFIFWGLDIVISRIISSPARRGVPG